MGVSPRAGTLYLNSTIFMLSLTPCCTLPVFTIVVCEGLFGGFGIVHCRIWELWVRVFWI